ncbi:hypothetical protein BU17DRAFT_69386 [Hysterangium stoloniferum]|nr:hypothetical protein BU17DRAFT_69386 [Hysterangium stoloniferum]
MLSSDSDLPEIETPTVLLCVNFLLQDHRYIYGKLQIDEDTGETIDMHQHRWEPYFIGLIHTVIAVNRLRRRCAFRDLKDKGAVATQYRTSAHKIDGPAAAGFRWRAEGCLEACTCNGHDCAYEFEGAAVGVKLDGLEFEGAAMGVELNAVTQWFLTQLEQLE